MVEKTEEPGETERQNERLGKANPCAVSVNCSLSIPYTHTRHEAYPNLEHKLEIPIPRKHTDQTLEVQDGIVSRLIEQRERLKGDENCPKCGHYNLELKVLLDEIDKLSKLQNAVSKKGIQRMRESDEARS